MRKTLLMTAAFSGIVLAAAGCGNKMWVLQYPAFYSEDLKTVAVAPFDSSPGGPAGLIMADKLAGALRDNGSYRIVHPVRSRPTTQPTTQPGEEGSLDELLESLRQRGDVQAVIIGSVEVFHAASYEYYHPVRRSYWHRGHYHYDYYDLDYYIRTDATAAAWASMINVSDGETIHSTPALLTASESDVGYPPGQGIRLLDEAANHVVEQMVEEFAIVRKQIKVSDDALRMASGEVAGQWQYAGEFSADDERIFLVVRLPRQAGRNLFRVTIRRAGQDAILAETEFTWDAEADVWVMELETSELIETGGSGKYEARFYSQGDEAMKRGFTIRPTPGGKQAGG